MQCVYFSLPIWCCYAVLNSQLSNSSNKPVVCCLIHTHTYIHRYVHTGAWTHTHLLTQLTQTFTHMPPLAVILHPRERGRKMTIYLLWAVGLRQHRLPAPEERKKESKSETEEGVGRQKVGEQQKRTEEEERWTNKKRMSQKEPQVESEGASLLVDVEQRAVVWSSVAFGCVTVWLRLVWVGLKTSGGNKPGQEKVAEFSRSTWKHTLQALNKRIFQVILVRAEVV